MKGKYAARASNRRAASDAESAEEVYKRNVVRLTRERDEARAERDNALAEWKKEARILRAQLSEGTSPRVEALIRELTRVREIREKLIREVRGYKDDMATLGERVADHFVVEHGVSFADRFDVLADFFPNHEHGLVIKRAGR